MIIGVFHHHHHHPPTHPHKLLEHFEATYEKTKTTFFPQPYEKTRNPQKKIKNGDQKIQNGRQKNSNWVLRGKFFLFLKKNP